MEHRTEDEITDQCAELLVDRNHDRWPPSTLRLLFSMALTWCHLERAGAYSEHDSNRLLRRMVGDARDMFGIVSPNLQRVPGQPKAAE
jgi:hypothetical protein